MKLLLLAALAAPLLSQSSADANKAIARRFYEEIWNQQKLGAADEIFAPSYKVHDPRVQTPGLETPRILRDSIAAWQKSSSASAHIDDQLADGDRVTTRWTWRLKSHSWWQRTLSGRESIEIGAIDIFRFENGKVAEVWRLRDDLGAEEQLGVSKLYYLQGFLFGAVTALIVSRVLRGRPPSAPKS